MYVTPHLTLNFQNNTNISLLQILAVQKMLPFTRRYEDALTFLPRASGMKKRIAQQLQWS
jgi:hypothetical protein